MHVAKGIQSRFLGWHIGWERDDTCLPEVASRGFVGVTRWARLAGRDSRGKTRVAIEPDLISFFVRPLR